MIGAPWNVKGKGDDSSSKNVVDVGDIVQRIILMVIVVS